MSRLFSPAEVDRMYLEGKVVKVRRSKGDDASCFSTQVDWKNCSPIILGKENDPKRNALS